MKNKFNCIICWILVPIFIFTIGFYCKINTLPNTVFSKENQDLKSNYSIKSKKVFNGFKNENVLSNKAPKTIANKSTQEKYVYPGGTPVGVKLNIKGVLVIAFCDINTSNGKIMSPSAQCGIQIGDNILKINDESINSSEELMTQLQLNKDKEILITIQRNDKIIKKYVKTIKDEQDNRYKIGLWVRDSTSGIGTLTFYDKKSGKFGALGHPITDIDTGTILNINNGMIMESSVISVKKGEKGDPGELRGMFTNEEERIGEIQKNTICGIYGNGTDKLIGKKFNRPMKIALRTEVKEGPAKILTTIDGQEPKLYNIEIEKLLIQEVPGPKSMVIRITDPELLAKTGGIVQGMSGSPIIQNDKIVGAVTHVLINKPNVGYGIYIEWMLKDADILNNY